MKYTFIFSLPTEFVKVMNRWNDALPSDLQNASCDNLTFTEKLIKLLSNHMIQKKASSQWCDSLVSAISQIMGKNLCSLLISLFLRSLEYGDKIEC